MDDKLVEGLVFGILCGTFCFVVTVAIENASVLRWAQLASLVIVIPVAQYAFGLPAMAAGLVTVGLLNVYTSIVDALDAKKFADTGYAPVPEAPEIRRFGDIPRNTAELQTAKSDEELTECFS